MARKTPQDKTTKGKKLKSALKKPSQRNTRRKAKKTKHVSWSSDVPADEVPEPVVQPGVAAQLQLFFAALPVNDRHRLAARWTIAHLRPGYQPFLVHPLKSLLMRCDMREVARMALEDPELRQLVSQSVANYQLEIANLWRFISTISCFWRVAMGQPR